MTELLRFLVKNSGLLLFIVFQSISLFLLFNYNKKQKEIFLYSTNKVVGGVQNATDQIQNYLHLHEANEKLNEENASLYSEVQSLKNKLLDLEVNELQEISSRTVTGAKVLTNTVHKTNNVFVINRGKKDGIKKGMGVLSNYSPVGVIFDVGNNFSRALSILNSEFNLDVKVHRKNYFGTLNWTAPETKSSSLNYIPTHADLSKGDSLFTSGYSGIFPGELFVGTINEVKAVPGSHFYDVSVNLYQDAAQINYVYILENNYAFIDSLAQQ